MPMIAGHRPPVRVLVTGFGPFPGVRYNASATVVRELAQSAPAPGIELFAGVIPVIWAEARRAALDAAARVKPHAVLHFGVSKRASGFEIETRAFNIGGLKEDHAGLAWPARRLDRFGMPVLRATIPPPLLLGALRRDGYPAQLSRSAGRYLCNAVFYWSLAGAGPGGPLIGFVHMPALGAEDGVRSLLTHSDAVECAHVLVRTAAQAVLSARHSGGRMPRKV